MVHDEYQGNLHPGRCPQDRYGPCTYHAVTLAVSSDAGQRFHPARVSGFLIAPPPYRYRPGRGPIGIFAPTNVIRGSDGALYAFVRFRDPDGKRGACLIRSSQIADAPWRAWDGNGFGSSFFDPYRRHPSPRTDCRSIAPKQIGQMAESLSFNRAISRYVMVGMAADRSDGRPRGTGVYFSLSNDLLSWTPRRLLMAAPTVQTHLCGQPTAVAYPSLLDPDSGSRNFETSDRRAFLYFTELHYRNCRRTPDRDLVRVPIEVRRR